MQGRSLEGITFGYKNNDTVFPHDPRVRHLHEGIMANDRWLRGYIQSLGGIIVEDTAEGIVEDTDYRFNSVAEPKQTIRAGIRAISGIGYRYIAEVPFGELEQPVISSLKEDIDAGHPRLFAYTLRDRGHAKYLIETSEQVEKIEQLGKEYVNLNGTSLYSDFVVRPFIETPSDFFTSYRVVVSASGDVLAAALLYSGHRKSESKTIVRACQDMGVPELAFMTRHFEDPESPYFLNAKDVRSNIICGGSMIPLMGDNRQALRPGEADILAAHNLDPHRPETPEELLKYGRTIGRTIGPKIDLAIGADFIQDQYGHQTLLEVNACPTGYAYNACHFGGHSDINHSMHEARLATVNLIADEQ